MKNKEKICLITPPSPFLLDERVFLHLGALKVASSLEAQGHKVDFLDLSGVDNFLDVVETYLASHLDVHTFGLTATTPQIPSAVKICKMIKRFSRKVILGGPHVTLMHTATKKENKRAIEDIARLSYLFDVLVCGDGEYSIFEALETKSGVVDADDRKSDLFLTNQQFSELPLPARHLVDVKSYNYKIENENATSLIAQLGCPFHCTFCSGRNSPFLRKMRTRSSESVIHEIDHLYQTYGFKGFMFYDDELNVNKNFVQLMDMISDYQDKHAVEFKLRGFVKAELFNEDQAKAMHRAGFRWLLTGFESGDERILKNIKKIATRDDNTRCVETAKANNLKVKALMSIGHAGESFQSVENTKNWILETEPEDFDCTIITTYPGSPYFDDAFEEENYYVYEDKKTKDRLYQAKINYLKDLDYYKGDPSGGYVSYVWTDYISAKDLVTQRNKLENEVREKLNIPFNPGRPGIKYEHSMGMGNISIPDYILKTSKQEGT